MAELRPDRLIALREERGLSQAALAREVGIGQSTIVRLEAGGTRNPREVIAISRALNCSPEYLLGESDQRGGMLNGEADGRSGQAILERAADSDVVELEEIDLRYGLGGTYVDGPIVAERRQFSRAWLRQFTVTPPEHLFWATGDGESMEPTIRSGEVILIDRSQHTPRMADGIWAIAWGDIGMIKRLRPMPDGSLKILSDNPAVPPDTAVDGEVHIIGRVIAVMRRL